MGTSSGEKFEIDEADGGQKRILRASHLKAASSEEQNSGVREAPHLTTRASLRSLFRLFGPCCSGAEASSQRSVPQFRSWYYSARIQRVIDGGELQSENATSRTEAEIEASRTHWSEVAPAVSQTEQSGKTYLEYFEVLKRRKCFRREDEIVFEQIPEHEEFIQPGLFDDYWRDCVVVGEKLAEGGQAEIYAATSGGDAPMVVKVFKDRSVLQHLDKQIPPALLRFHQRGDRCYSLCGIYGATVLKDERLKDRFAFVMDRCWGDLRKLIDHQMMLSSLNAGPPFSSKQVLHLMWSIAGNMGRLHYQRPPILHNDLKAANVLVNRDRFTSGPQLTNGMYDVRVADFECSIGVVGTGFWRAPEVLQQLKDRVPMSDLKFSEKCDVYSYGMTCYELVTGRIPFEEYTCPRDGHELVLKGGRPELPPDFHPFVKGIITSCWHPNLSERPSFYEIVWKCCQFRSLCESY